MLISSSMRSMSWLTLPTGRFFRILLSHSYASVVQIPLVMLAFLGVGAVTYSLGPPLLGEISPVSQRGAVLGLSNAMFSLAGLVAPWLTGHIVDLGLDPAAGFRQGFLFAGCLMCAGAILAAEASNDRREFPNPQGSRGTL